MQLASFAHFPFVGTPVQVSAVVGDGKHFFAFHVQLASFAHFPFVGNPVHVSPVVGGDGGGTGDGAAVSQIRHDAGHRRPITSPTVAPTPKISGAPMAPPSLHQPNDASWEQL